MFSSKYCFLTHIQVSQETGKMIWYSHLFKNFPQFIVIHTVKGFNTVNKTQVDVLLEPPCFLYDPVNVSNLISGLSAISKPSLNIGKFLIHVMLKLNLEDFEHDVTSMGEDCKKCKKAKWLSEEALQTAGDRREAETKGEKDRYTHLNAEFQR